MSAFPSQKYFCGYDRRRSLVREASLQSPDNPLNGIDYLEVIHREAPSPEEAQRLLRIYFIRPITGALQAALQAADFGPRHVRIAGGERITGITCDRSRLQLNGAQTEGVYLEVHVTLPGDFSTYTLRLVEGENVPLQVPDPVTKRSLLDPLLTAIDFSFKADCPAQLDCQPACACGVEAGPLPELDYLAKDYASFRQLLFDRFSVLAPQWTERNPADLGVTLVELLAYVGDYLSYRQDAITTEAYLGTARRRSSLHRHARLLDFPMHDGCNARAWVQVRLSPSAPATGLVLPRLLALGADGRWRPRTEAPLPGPQPNTLRTRFFTRVHDALGRWFSNDDAPVVAAGSDALFDELAASLAPEVFEPLDHAWLYPSHNEIAFYTWGDARCCLPRGATRATLAQPPLARTRLRAGDLLVFAEVRGPKTGEPADADRNHRHAVRLTEVRAYADAQGAQPLKDELTGVEIVEIEWHEEDALPFPFCVSSVNEQTGEALTDVTMAWGNMVPADHGWTLSPEPLPPVPAPDPALALAGDEPCGAAEGLGVTPARYRPALREGPLTQSVPYSPEVAGAPAARFLQMSLDDASPAVRLGDDRGQLWLPEGDLMSSDAFAPDFVAEVENDGTATLRFGDDVNGMRPAERSRFYAAYRVGNGPAGNVGAETIHHLAAEEAGLLDPSGDPDLAERRILPATVQRMSLQLVTGVLNPLPARGGVAPQPLEEVRQFAPVAFNDPRRAVTPDDYAQAAEKHPAVQRARATLRWTGSWHTIFLTVDRRGGRPVDAAFETSLRAFLEPLRLAGHDLEIAGPRFFPVELVIDVCLTPTSFRGTVLAALLDVFSSGIRANGTHGFFHPDELTFGTAIYASRLLAAAQAVPGVSHTRIRFLRRLGSADPTVPEVLAPGPLEILRLENNPSFLDRGRLHFELHGGR